MSFGQSLIIIVADPHGVATIGGFFPLETIPPHLTAVGLLQAGRSLTSYSSAEVSISPSETRAWDAKRRAVSDRLSESGGAAIADVTSSNRRSSGPHGTVVRKKRKIAGFGTRD
jgi:hypothetical protein